MLIYPDLLPRLESSCIHAQPCTLHAGANPSHCSMFMFILIASPLSPQIDRFCGQELALVKRARTYTLEQLASWTHDVRTGTPVRALLLLLLYRET